MAAETLAAEGSLRDELDQNVNRRRKDEREINGARHGARRLPDFAARCERALNSKKGEHQQQHRITKRLAVARRADRNRVWMDKEDPNRDEEQQRQKLQDRDEHDRARAGSHTADIQRCEHQIKDQHRDDSSAVRADRGNERRECINQHIHHRRYA